MMQLNSMRKVVDTVNSEWRSPIAEEILKRWGYDEGSVYYFRASANFIFVFKKEGKRYFLRFIEDNQRNLEQIEAEIKILSFLTETSVKVCEPIRSLNNKFVEEVQTEIGTFYAVVFTALEGKQCEIEEMDDEQFFHWGSTLGQLHHAFKRMPEDDPIKRPSWKDLLANIKETICHANASILKEWEKINNWAENLTITPDNFGIIHYDFELDNLSFTDDQIGILDFDDCSYHWFAADIAFALRDLFKENVDFSNPSYLQFLKGYSSKTTIDLEILKEIPWFLRMHKLVMFAKIHRAIDIKETEENPEWLNGLRNKLVEYISNYRHSLDLEKV